MKPSRTVKELRRKHRSGRTTHVNLGIELGFDVKTAQTLARHKTPHTTLNVYGRVNAERLRGAVETLGKAIEDAKRESRSRNSPMGVQRDDLPLAVGAEEMSYPNDAHGDDQHPELVSPRRGV